MAAADSLQIRLYDTVVTEADQDFLFTNVTVDDPSKKYESHEAEMRFTAKLQDVRRRNLEEGSVFLLRMSIVHPPVEGEE